MPIPTFDKLLRPVLALADREDVTRRSAAEAMAREFNLSPEEAIQPLPSGRSTVIRNRTGWAMTFLTKGGLIAKIAPKTYRATDRGRDFLTKYPQQITGQDLEAIPGWEEAWNTGKKKRLAAGEEKDFEADHAAVV
jgi:restriction system protein